MTQSSAAPANTHPYESLTPDVVLDALATLGLYGDGRLTGLNSYENRVYQVHLEDRSVVVVKFYRPGRWSEAEILEEHGFSLELAAARCRPCRRWPSTARRCTTTPASPSA